MVTAMINGLLVNDVISYEEVLKNAILMLNVGTDRFEYLMSESRDDTRTYLENEERNLGITNEMKSITALLTELKQSPQHEELYNMISDVKESMSKLSIDDVESRSRMTERLSNLMIDVRDSISKSGFDGRLLVDGIRSITDMQKELLTKLDAKSETKTEKSQALGVIGEEMVMDILKDSFRSYEIIKASTQGHRGDIIMRDRLLGLTIMFEVKNKLKITKDDIDKFEYDLDQVQAATGGSTYGIFVSLCCKIGSCVDGPYISKDMIFIDNFSQPLIEEMIERLREISNRPIQPKAEGNKIPGEFVELMNENIGAVSSLHDDITKLASLQAEVCALTERIKTKSSMNISQSKTCELLFDKYGVVRTKSEEEIMSIVSDVLKTSFINVTKLKALSREAIIGMFDNIGHQSVSAYLRSTKITKDSLIQIYQKQCQ